nr:MAG TPA: regulatory protein [Caudoviricetes sp.]
MDDIKNYNPAEAETLDSREVAEMVEKNHKDLLRDIRGYIEIMQEADEISQRKIAPSDFFIESTFENRGKQYPCFLVTKKGCEFIANKLTGEKGTKFTALYVTRFNIMEEREKAAIGGKTAKNGKTPEELAAADKRATAMLLNAKNRAASFLQKLYDRAGTKPEYQAMALSDFYSEDGIHLPRMAFQDMKQTYDKSAIAEKLGVYSKASGGKVPHAQAIGAIISTLDISEDERERLPYCNNGHDGVDYQYTESVVEKVRAWIEAHGRPSPITVNGKNYAVVYREG